MDQSGHGHLFVDKLVSYRAPQEASVAPAALDRHLAKTGSSNIMGPSFGLSGCSLATTALFISVTFAVGLEIST